MSAGFVMKNIGAWDGFVKRVVIHTSTYLKVDGGYSAGGRQRHIRDLASVIRDDWNKDVVIVQKGLQDFDLVCNYGFRVKGVKSDCSALGDPGFAKKVRSLIQEGDGLLYASGEDAWPFFHQNSKAIQHGIWWDGPQSAFTRFIQKRRVMACMASVRSMLCVDTNFINWLRCQGSVGYELCEKCYYVPNYTDLNLLAISDQIQVSPLRLICARRYEKKRGTDVFIDSLGVLKKRGFPFVAHISTSGGLSEVKERVKNAGVAELVSVTEDSMEDVLTRYGRADVAVVPTLWSEGTSLACVEALCSGVPVVTTPVGGLGNLVVPGFNGYIVNPQADAIASAIERFRDRELLATMRQNCLGMRPALSMSEWRRRTLEWLKT